MSVYDLDVSKPVRQLHNLARERNYWGTCVVRHLFKICLTDHPRYPCCFPVHQYVALYRTVSVKTVTINRAERLRDVYIDFATGLGLPVPNNCCATGILKFREVRGYKGYLL